MDSSSKNNESLHPPKPRSERFDPEITRLPSLTWYRRGIRKLMRGLIRFLIWVFMDLKVSGILNMPAEGAALVVSNHLGDADALIAWAFSPRIDTEVIIKSELNDFPILGTVMNMYGVIWVHRGEPDRRLIREVMRGFGEGRIIGIAPEGRESLIGGLEQGTGGAAYLALKADVPLVPVTFTGTENARVYSNLKRLRRTSATVTVGPAFIIQHQADLRTSIELGTKEIMLTLARQLPPSYRGVYAQEIEATNGG